MTLAHTFDAEKHVYHVPGHYTFSTSDVINLNGLSDYGQVPKKILEFARWRGTQMHRAIELLETGELDVSSIPEVLAPWFDAYLEFREDSEFQLVGKPEQTRVYFHEGCGQMIGCTLDMTGLIHGVPYIVEPKFTHPQSGKAEKQTCLRWRAQLQSQLEAISDDERVWDEIDCIPRRAVVNLRRKPVWGKRYKIYEFEGDDVFLWDSMIRVAQAKKAAGFEVTP